MVTHPGAINNENSILHPLNTSIVENESTAPKEILAKNTSATPTLPAEETLPNNIVVETAKDNLLAENSINTALDALAMPVETIAKPSPKPRKHIARSSTVDPYDYNID